MRHIRMQIGTDAVSDLAEAFPVDHPWIGRSTGDDQLWLVLGRQFLNFIIVKQAILTTHAVLDCIEPLAGLVRGRTVGQVTTGCQ